MNKQVSLIIFIVLVFFTKHLYSQDFFTNAELIATFLKEERTEGYVKTNWKRTFNKPRWNRIEASINFEHSLGLWQLIGGLENFYIIDNEILNIYETKPWLGGQITLRIVSVILFRQQIKGEVRAFFVDGDNNQNEVKWRTRFQSSLEILLSKNLYRQNQWFCNLEAEWYVVDDQYTLERYAPISDYRIGVGYKFPNSNIISIGYEFGNFSDSFESSRNKGNSISLLYKF